MGKGKRLKEQRRRERELGFPMTYIDEVFQEANVIAKLPAYDEATFLKEYEESGYKYDVFRHHTYLKARKDPNFVDDAVEAGIVKAMEDNGIVVEKDGTMVQK